MKKKNYILEEINKDVEETGLQPFDLFQFAKEGIERQAVVLYHSNIFDVENETIYCRIEGNPDLLKKIKTGEICFMALFLRWWDLQFFARWLFMLTA